MAEALAVVRRRLSLGKVLDTFPKKHYRVPKQTLSENIKQIK